MTLTDPGAMEFASGPLELHPVSSGEIALALEEASLYAGVIARRKGDVPRAMISAARSHSARFRGAFRRSTRYLGHINASLDGAGMPIAWRHRVASIVDVPRGDPQCAFFEDARAVEGAADIPYAIPNILVEHVIAESPGLGARAGERAGLAENAFAVESFIDELAALAGASPVDYRRRMLADSPRAVAVLDAAVSRSDWDAPLEEGAGRGLAMQATRRSFLAVIAEVERRGRGMRVARVTCAVECSGAADPRAARRQVEAGILAGLASALARPGDCRADSREAPAIEIHFTVGPDATDGIAESAAAAIAPAVANAIFNSTGNRIRTLPIVATPKEVS